MYTQDINTSQRYTTQVNFEANCIGEQGGILLSSEPVWVAKPFPNNPIWGRLGSIFDNEHFLYPAIPVDIGVTSIKMDETPLRILRTPIKRAGDLNLYIPQELERFVSLLKHVLETELIANDDYLNSHGHITVEHTYIEKNNVQRVPGWHVDGFQGARQHTHSSEHSYLWCSIQPAEFCIQPFFINHIDSARHSVFAEFERQAQDINVFSGLANHIYLIDPYIVHRSTPMKESNWRTFVRITFSDIELEDPMNTVNKMIPLAQNYESRIDHRDRLYIYENEIDLYPYGVCR